jgi:hypothetical protein
MSSHGLIVSEEWVTRHYDGKWPDFHDAEVIRLELLRDLLRINVDLVTQDRPPDLVVSLAFDEVQDVELGGFNHQNALLALHIERRGDGWTYVDLQSAHGLGGAFRCQAVTVVGVSERT